MILKYLNKIRQWIHYSITFELEPLSSIEIKEDGSLMWHGNDPQIKVINKNNTLIQGYYMVEIDIVDLKLSANACIYTDQGIGFNEGDMYLIPMDKPTSLTKTYKRVCFFNNAVKSIRFDPSEESGGASSLSVKFVKLSENKAKKLMCKKVKPVDDLQIEELYSIYNSYFKKQNNNNYKSWIYHNETINRLPQEKIDELISNFRVKPKISIICPVYNTKPEWLVSCIESVVYQSYGNWELILIDDASSNQSHYEVLENYRSSDSRVKVIYLEINSHISAATNAGIEKSNADYILFLDHDDELSHEALFEVCCFINKYPYAKIIYSDEDLMSESGERIAPHFKSDWNSELLLAHNYVTHLCCYKSQLINELGGMRIGYEGAQDYDLILRASKLINTEDIIHIPKILYHWRMVEGSTALSSGAKSYATDAGLKALEDHIKEIGINASVSHAENDNFYAVSYKLPEKCPLVSIIIPTRDGMDVLKPCIETLLSITNYKKYEIIILDNGSEKQDTLNYLNEISKKQNIKIVRDDGEFNYSRINNVAVSHSSGDVICLLNNDIEIISPNWLTEMVSVALQDKVGCVGAKLLYPDMTIQHAGVILGLGGYAAHAHRGGARYDAGYFNRAQVRQQLSAVTAACLVVKRSTYDLVSGLDTSFQVAYNDVDFCLRVQAAGFNNIYTPYAELYHHESKTRGDDTSPEKQKRFEKEKALLLKRWSGIIRNDPFYNINLTRVREDFSI